MSSKKTKKKRIESLIHITDALFKNGILDGDNYSLNKIVVAELVEHYYQDLNYYKSCYNIEDRINPAKIAGLMASVIMRYKPLRPKNSELVSYSRFDGNDKLAIYHGIVLCSIKNDDALENEEMSDFINNPIFDKWFDMFRFILRKQNHTPETLILVFETIRSFVFHNNK